MLLMLRSDRPYPATGDLDVLRRGDGPFKSIRKDLEGIIVTPVPPDAVVFDGDGIRIESIRAESRRVA